MDVKKISYGRNGFSIVSSSTLIPPHIFDVNIMQDHLMNIEQKKSSKQSLKQVAFNAKEDDEEGIGLEDVAHSA